MADLSLIIRPWTDRIIDTAIQHIYPTGVGWHSKSMDPATNSAANRPVIGCMKQNWGLKCDQTPFDNAIPDKLTLQATI